MNSNKVSKNYQNMIYLNILRADLTEIKKDISDKKS